MLRGGGTILYPTDTIWGLGCDACSASAIEKVYQIKKRDLAKSMLLLVADAQMAERYVQELPDIAYSLFELADQPLTLVLDQAINLPDNLIAADGSIGMRVPDDAFCQAVLRQFRRPLVSTSVNFSGHPAARHYEEIDPLLLKAVDYVADWRRDERGSPRASSVMKVGIGGEIKILRG